MTIFHSSESKSSRLGLRQQTFFINRASRPLEVWNSSVLGYQINYFNVATGEYKQNLVDAQVPLEEALNGKNMKRYKVFRSSRAVSVVGVDITITVATQMLHLEPTMMFNYRYDLELDAAGVVIGGEWHVESHPRFIWLIDKPDFKPTSPEDPFAKQGWGGEPLSPQSLSLLRSVSEKNRVFPSVIYGLFEMSRR